MKKLFLLLLSLALMLSLCACDTLEALREVELPPLPEITPSPARTPNAQTPAPAEEPQPAGSQPEAAVSDVLVPETQVVVNFGSTHREEYDPAEGTELILTFSYETPNVRIEGRDAAAAKINDYIAMLDETYYTGNDYGAGSAVGFNMMLELAQDNYGFVMGTGAEDQPLLLSASRSAAVLRADSQVLSLVYFDYAYTGGAHGTYTNRGYVFDTETGERLRMESLSDDPEALSSFLVDYMLGLTESDPEYSTHIDMISAQDYAEAFAALLRDGSWYLDGEGMLLFSDLYEISSYASGEVVFRVPYDQLRGKIYDRYLPQERQGSGELSLLPMEQVGDGSLEIIDLVTAHAEGGRELCLKVEGIVYDLKLSQGIYSKDFYETSQLWYASFMSDSALQLTAAIPSGLPELMLRYTTADGESHTLYLSHSEDGSPALVDDSIQAVG